MSQTTSLPARITTLGTLIQQSKEQLKTALADKVPVDYFINVAMTAMRTNPRLLQCEQTSIMKALLQAAQLQLIPEGVLGHAYLVPRKDKNGVYHADFQIGYRGLIALAHRSIEAEAVDSDAIYSNDKFSYEKGTKDKLVHAKPLGKKERGFFVGAWAMITYKSGCKAFEVMTEQEIEDVKKRSRTTSEDTPWRTDYDSMARKTVLRRLLKYQPISADVLSAVVKDEYTELGVQAQGEQIKTEEEFSKITNNKMQALKQELQATEVKPPTVRQHPEPEQAPEPIKLSGEMKVVDFEQEPAEPDDIHHIRHKEEGEQEMKRFDPINNQRDFLQISLNDKRGVIAQMLPKAGKDETYLNKPVFKLTEVDCRNAYIALAATIESKGQ